MWKCPEIFRWAPGCFACGLCHSCLFGLFCSNLACRWSSLTKVQQVKQPHPGKPPTFELKNSYAVPPQLPAPQLALPTCKRKKPNQNLTYNSIQFCISQYSLERHVPASLLVVGHRGLLCCCSSTFSSGLQNGRHLSIQFLRKVRQPTLVCALWPTCAELAEQQTVPTTKGAHRPKQLTVFSYSPVLCKYLCSKVC